MLAVLLILLVLGAAFILWVYYYTRKHPPRRDEKTSARKEPFFSLRRMQPKQEVAHEPAASRMECETENTAPPQPASEEEPSNQAAEETQPQIFFLALRLPEEGVEASRVLHGLQRLGLVLDERHIYHYAEPDGEIVFSVADLYEPGILDPLPGDTLLRGLNFFSTGVPSAAAARRFERMLGMARECLRDFGGRLEDAQHRPLTAARELEMRLHASGARND